MAWVSGRARSWRSPCSGARPRSTPRVQDLRARRWLVAAIYRNNSYVVPHGHVIIRAGARLLLTGEPEILPHIADYLRAGVARFPLQYGARTVAVTTETQDDAFWDEFRYFVDHTRTRIGRALTPKTAPPPDVRLKRGKMEVQTINATDSLMTVVRRDVPSIDCGCLAIPKSPSVSSAASV